MNHQTLIDNYKDKHRHPLNRLSHYIGIPMIVASLVVVFIKFKTGVALFILGWVFQVIGHLIEGNQPAFFKNPVYLLVGPMWVFKRLKRAVLGMPPETTTKK